MKRLVGSVAALAVATLLVVGPGAGVAWAKGSKSGAWNVCSQFVKDRLNAPATSDFAEYKDEGTSVTKQGKTYTVLGYVDAENSFGANVRTTYICTVRYKSGRTYTLIDLQTPES
jgi:hypothetical protein